MEVRTASCACGELRVTCVGAPALVSLCHCADCQKRTGSLFGVAAFFPREHVEVEGETRRFTRDSISGRDVTFHFCPECGSSVFWEPERRPEMIAVAVGAFADPAFPPPSQEVHTEGRHPWVLFGTPES